MIGRFGPHGRYGETVRQVLTFVGIVLGISLVGSAFVILNFGPPQDCPTSTVYVTETVR